MESLNEHEKLEIEVFKTMKKDPYFKHYIDNCIWENVEQRNEVVSNFLQLFSGTRFEETIPYQDIKFPLQANDGENLFRRRFTPNGYAVGSGKRKSAKAVCFMKPGEGNITINGKPMINYFLHPWQWWIIMRPLILTNYTCLVDIKLKIRGGGVTGQPECAWLAIAKALVSF